MKAWNQLFALLLVACMILSVSFSVSAKEIDPAKESETVNKLLEKINIGSLDELETEEEILPNGDVKIWHIIDRGPAWVEKWLKEEGNIASQREYDWTIACEGSLPEFEVALTRFYLGSVLDFSFEDFQDFDDLGYDDKIDGMKLKYSGFSEALLTVGDTNLDFDVDMKDVLALRQIIINPSLVESDRLLPYQADVVYDHSYDMKDNLVLRKYLAGMIDELE